MLNPRQIGFVAWLVLCCGYAVWKGERPERIGAAINLGAVLCSFPLEAGHSHWREVMLGVSTIDMGVCVGFFLLALGTDRFWPIWSCGFALASVLTHLARARSLDIPFYAYFRAEADFSYLALAALAIGTLTTQRGRRRARSQPDYWPPADSKMQASSRGLSNGISDL